MKTRYIAPVSIGILFVVVGILFGSIFDFYHKFPGIDKFFHTGEGLAIAWFAYIYFYDDFKNISRFKIILLLTGIGALYGVLWEFLEYIPQFIHSGPFVVIKKYLYGGDLMDTLGDLAADMIGAFVYLFYKNR